MSNRNLTVLLIIGLAALLVVISISANKDTGKEAAISPIDISKIKSGKDADMHGKTKNTGLNPEDVKGPHPVITFTETVHDFGTHISGENLETDFIFKNTGNAVLKIDRVKGG